MSWLSNLFGRGKSPPKPPSEAELIAEFCRDLGGDAKGASRAFEGIEHLYAQDVFATVDWADSADMVLSNLKRLFSGENALSEQAVAQVLQVGNTAGEKGRGFAALPTLCALDDALEDSGTRLLWVDVGGDAYDLERVPDAIWAKWHDVKIGNVSILEVDMRNEIPNKRVLAEGPR